MLQIREAGRNDLKGLLVLYTQLHNNPMPVMTAGIKDLWNEIMEDDNHHIIIGCIDGEIVTSCVVVIIPNLTNNQRPYALVENVITEERFRGKGFATAVLNHAKEIATREDCYKIMLLTGSKKDSTLNFYKRAGYNSNDKTAFIQWL